MLHEAAGFAACDLDNCIDPDTGASAPWAAALSARLASYTEVSPSGTGLHILHLAMLPDGKGLGTGFGAGAACTRQAVITVANTTSWHAAHHWRAAEVVNAIIAERAVAKVTAAAVCRQQGKPAVRSDEEVIRLARSAKNGEFTQLWAGEWENFNYASQSEAGIGPGAHPGLLCRGSDSAEQVERLFGEPGPRTAWAKWAERDDYREATVAGAPAAAGGVLYAGGEKSRYDLGDDWPALLGRRLSTIQPERVDQPVVSASSMRCSLAADGDLGLGKRACGGQRDLAARLSAATPCRTACPPWPAVSCC